MKRGELWWADLGPRRPQEQFQIRAIPRAVLIEKIRSLTPEELAEVELATDEALGRVDPE